MSLTSFGVVDKDATCINVWEITRGSFLSVMAPVPFTLAGGGGSVSGFFYPDGTQEDLRFTADEFGYQPQSALLPTPHPLPAHALEQLRIAEEQRATGITFDQRGFRVNRK
ncbi:Cuticle protein [Homarus americanus]|uniref:Cuticle protein n=1 Tax=Homarus americanus TaxID=6706 RepID=A0A8J5TKG6_HOMAM|nr:Cuticle protein [Homarus americanus]